MLVPTRRAGGEDMRTVPGGFVGGDAVEMYAELAASSEQRRAAGSLCPHIDGVGWGVIRLRIDDVGPAIVGVMPILAHCVNTVKF